MLFDMRHLTRRKNAGLRKSYFKAIENDKSRNNPIIQTKITTGVNLLKRGRYNFRHERSQRRLGNGTEKRKA